MFPNFLQALYVFVLVEYLFTKKEMLHYIYISKFGDNKWHFKMYVYYAYTVNYVNKTHYWPINCNNLLSARVP